MSINCKQVLEFMNLWAPENLAEDWDNVGLQIGDSSKEVKKILLSLDLDKNVSKMAIKENFDLIITHHPFIFKGLKSITKESYDGRIIIDLIKNDIALYTAHTNLDQARNGVNDELAKVFKLKEVEILEITDNEELGYGRVGIIDDINLLEYIEIIKKNLNLHYLTLYGQKNKTVKKIGLLGGSGSSFIESAYKHDVDLFITGDVKYHDAQLADKLGMTIIDVGHYYSERIVLPLIKRELKSKFGDVAIKTYDTPSPNYEIL